MRAQEIAEGYGGVEWEGGDCDDVMYLEEFISGFGTEEHGHEQR